VLHAPLALETSDQQIIVAHAPLVPALWKAVLVFVALLALSLVKEDYVNPAAPAINPTPTKLPVNSVLRASSPPMATPVYPACSALSPLPLVKVNVRNALQDTPPMQHAPTVCPVGMDTALLKGERV